MTGVLQKPDDPAHGGMLQETCRPRKVTSLLQRDLRDGCVLHNQETGIVYTLNSSASFILTFCTGDYSLAQIAVETATAFGLQAEDALRDVISTVRTLLNAGLLDPGICRDGTRSIGDGNG
ncbi:MAG: PqqD family protein [Thermodesulfovibrionales bacterium]